jgi:hypothetical protein
LVDKNYPAMSAAAQAIVIGTGSWLDVEASSVGSKAQSSYPAEVKCENGGRAHLHWPPLLEIVEDVNVSESRAQGDYKQYRMDGRTLDIDEHHTIVAGELRVRIKCHSGTELASPAVREYEWITSAASCNHFELAQHVRNCVEAEDVKQAQIPLKYRKPPLKLPQGLAGVWRVFYTERATSDETIGHEGDLLGPIIDRPIWDVLPGTVSLHLYPNDKAGPEAKRQKAVADRLIQQQLNDVNRSRAMERQNKLARMYPEERDKAILEFQEQESRHQKHVQHMRNVRAAKQEGLGPSDRIPTPPPSPSKDKIVKGKGRAMYEAFQGLGSDDSDWLTMKEERSGDPYWWNPITGAISWVDPKEMPSTPDRESGQAARAAQTSVKTISLEEEAVRGIWEVVENAEASEVDVRMALNRLKPRGRTAIKSYEHRIV